MKSSKDDVKFAQNGSEKCNNVQVLAESRSDKDLGFRKCANESAQLTDI